MSDKREFILGGRCDLCGELGRYIDTGHCRECEEKLKPLLEKARREARKLCARHLEQSARLYDPVPGVPFTEDQLTRSYGAAAALRGAAHRVRHWPEEQLIAEAETER